MKVQEVLPYDVAGESKKGQVRIMFDRISGKYDFLNHLLSVNIDKYWRKRAIARLEPYRPQIILDVASGTGDLAIAARRLNPSRIIATDLSEGMLEVARKKIQALGLESIIETRTADGENLPFPDHSFDAVMIGFGLRNFGDIHAGIREFLRVLNPGGSLVILEFSMPSSRIVKAMYLLYFRHLLPFIGRIVSKDHMAYSYLNRSVEAFPSRHDMLDLLGKVGYVRCSATAFTLGISTVYQAFKPE